MSPRALKTLRIAALLVGAFAVGGASAEVAIRTHRAVEQVKAERETGAAGQLVALQLTDLRGQIVAQPRLICPKGKAAKLVLHDPARPGEIRLAFRVEAEREASGDIALDYELWIPERSMTARGKVSLAPGAEHSMALAGGELVATWIAVPVPSAQFDALLEAARAARRAPPKSS